MWNQQDTATEMFYRRIPGRTGLPQKTIVVVDRELVITLGRLSTASGAA